MPCRAQHCCLLTAWPSRNTHLCTVPCQTWLTPVAALPAAGGLRAAGQEAIHLPVAHLASPRHALVGCGAAAAAGTHARALAQRACPVWPGRRRRQGGEQQRCCGGAAPRGRAEADRNPCLKCGLSGFQESCGVGSGKPVEKVSRATWSRVFQQAGEGRRYPALGFLLRRR